MHSKGSHKQNQKTTHRIGENIYKWSNQQGINLQTIQTPHTAQLKKKKKNNQKMGRRSKQTFLQRKHTDVPHLP